MTQTEESAGLISGGGNLKSQGLTFGQRAVRFDFNPNNDPEVGKIKMAFAAIIDGLNDKREAIRVTINSGEPVRLYSLAITHVEDACLRATSAVTWKP